MALRVPDMPSIIDDISDQDRYGVCPHGTNEWKGEEDRGMSKKDNGIWLVGGFGMLRRRILNSLFNLGDFVKPMPV